MNDLLLLLQAFRGIWAIDRKFAHQHFNIIQNVLAGHTQFEKGLEAEASKHFAYYGNERYSIYDEAPKGSVAIIPLIGVMMKHDQYCGSVGTTTIAHRIVEAANHKNISAIIIQSDTGGGAVNAIQPLVNAINIAKSNNKPVIGFIDDLCASAGLMSLAHCDLLIGSHYMAEIGSLGVMAAFADYQPVAEKEGVIFHKVYADQSSLKNKSFDNLLKGDYELLIKNDLNPIAENAIATFKSLRGSKIKDENVYAAEMYYAENALKIGLIDEIGTFEYAVKRASELAKSNRKNIVNSSNSNINSQSNHKINSIVMNRNQIPALLLVLGYETLELTDGKASLSRADIEKLDTYYSEKFGGRTPFIGATFEEDGTATITEKGMYALNMVITNQMNLAIAKAAKDGDDAKKAVEDRFANERQQYLDKIKKLEDSPENLDLPAGQGTPYVGDFVSFATGINAIELRPWNEAALAVASGNKKKANFIKSMGFTESNIDTFITDLKRGENKIDISNLNTELGAYYRETSSEITDMLVANEEISSIFPWNSTGTIDVYTRVTSYITEHLQPRNSGEWVEKGSNEFQAESIKMLPWQVTRSFIKEEMFQMMESWLATKTKGTNPYQESFVSYFIAYILRQIVLVERPLNAIKGVYVKPTANIAGASINSMNGFLKSLQNLIDSNRIFVSKVGKGNYALNDGSGNINKDHVYYKIFDIFESIPQKLRDAYNWVALISKKDNRERLKFEKEAIGTDANFAEKEKVNSYQNLTYKEVPHWQEGLIVITIPNNGVQLYRDKADDNRVTVERFKRNTHVHMDGAYGTMWALTGKKYATHALLKASAGENQRIFTNGEFGAYTAIPVAADDTSPSVDVHNVLRTSANTSATTITTIDDAVIGQIIYIIGGSNINSSQILASNTKFVGLGTNFTLAEGAGLELLVTDTDKFTVISKFDKNSASAIEFAADDATPSISGGYLFLTNKNNTASLNITDFEDALPSKTFKVVGSGGTHATTITKAAKFQYISATWTGNAGAEIILMKRTDGNFVEVLE
jgi:protease-4